MQKTLGEIAQIIQGELMGDPNLVVSGVSGIMEAQEGDVTFVGNSRYISLIEHTKATAIIAPDGVRSSSKPIIRTKDPSLAFAQIVAMVHPVEVRHPQGIHESAVIARSAKIGSGSGIGPCVVVEEEVEIGENTVVYAGCYIGYHVKIGRDCLIYPNVSIRERVVIGDRVFIQSGTVIGSEGFGYVSVGGTHRLIPQVGTVVVEDDVEIGANVTIDRARFDKTVIGRGSKIDNLVQIAHNVIIGPDSIIIAQAGISGSTRIGRGVTIAGQAGLVGHITVGDGAVLAAQAGVTKSVAANTIVSGYPARLHNEAKRINAYVQKLPELVSEVRALKKSVEALRSTQTENQGEKDGRDAAEDD
jgi:UDP-3-O-[3-hydroxymyristoyl] glucosamine N-acyltransferase